MEIQTRRRFLSHAAFCVLLLTTLPQILRILFNLLTEWTADRVESDVLFTVLSSAADFFGAVSFFAGMGIAIRLAFLFGLKKGGLWLVPLAVVYAVTLIAFSGFGRIPWQAAFAVFAVTAVLTVLLLFLWQTVERWPVALILGSLFLAIPGGLLVLLTAVPSVSELVGGLFYGLSDFCLTALILAVAARLADGMRRQALRRRASFSPRQRRKQDPLLSVILLSDLLYTGILVLNALPATLFDIREYGAPVNAAEWGSLLLPYGKCLLFFLLGCAVMLFAVRCLGRVGPETET